MVVKIEEEKHFIVQSVPQQYYSTLFRILTESIQVLETFGLSKIH